jgi:hypothetical protein
MYFRDVIDEHELSVMKSIYKQDGSAEKILLAEEIEQAKTILRDRGLLNKDEINVLNLVRRIYHMHIINDFEIFYLRIFLRNPANIVDLIDDEKVVEIEESLLAKKILVV